MWMSMGWSMIHCRSTKTKLNTKSSTEAKLVGVSDYLPYNIWLVYFLEEHGYSLQSNIIYQDNHSAIKMEKIVGTRVLLIPNTLTSDIFLSRIDFIKGQSRSNIVKNTLC